VGILTCLWAWNDVLPLLVVYVLAQRRVISGVTRGAIK